MERLIQSTSIPSKFNQSSSLLPRFDSPFTTSLSSPKFHSGFKFRVPNCSLFGPFALSAKPIDHCSNNNFYVNGLDLKPILAKMVDQILYLGEKVFNVGKTIVLSAVILTLLHPAFVSPAFASFPAAAKAGAAGGTLIRSELMNSAWTGFFAGCLHTLSGPDHLAALAPLSIGRTSMESAAVGALWGCGHDAGQVIFGLLFLLLKDRLHIEIFRTWGTIVVGITLFVIGAMGFKEASEAAVPVVALENGEGDITGFEALSAKPAIRKKKIGFTTFATGIVHGLQPDALLIILPALALPSRVAGAAFLGMFLVGTVVAMGSYTAFIGSCSQALKERVPKITEKLTWASSFVALALGLAILISQFFGLSLY